MFPFFFNQYLNTVSLNGVHDHGSLYILLFFIVISEAPLDRGKENGVVPSCFIHVFFNSQWLISEFLSVFFFKGH